MNATEAAMLCRFAKAACPQQKIDEYTPDVWLDLLGDLRFDDAKTALLAVAAKQPFVAPAEIRAEVRRIRSKRIADAEASIVPPAELADRPTADTCAWLAAEKRRIGDGELVDPDAYGELKPRYLPDVRELLPAPDDTPSEQKADR